MKHAFEQRESPSFKDNLCEIFVEIGAAFLEQKILKYHCVFIIFVMES